MDVMEKKKKGSRHIDRHMISIRGELYEKLRKAARENRRPISWELEYRLERSFDHSDNGRHAS